MRMKKFLTFLLTLAMVVSMLPATAFAANNTATTMRLAKTQGTVAVTNATGKKVTQTANMKLYNGYKMKTGAKSYAWISLDDTKVVKLDANSSVEVQKSGKSLTLYLSSGNIFFNVKEKLSGGESFYIKTSTMTTGVRGTSGCVRVIGPRVTELHLLTGELEVYVEHPGLGICDYKVLKAGQKARSMIAEYSMAEVGRQAAIVIEKLGANEVCGICSEEISRSMALQNRMILEGGFTVEEVESIVANHDERLAHDEAVADAKEAVIDQKVEKQIFPEDVDPLFEGEKEESKSSGGAGGSSSGSGSVTPPTDDEEDSGELEEADLTRTVDTEDELIEALDEYNALAGTMRITLTDDITMDANALNGLMMERNGGKAALTIDTAGNILTLAAPIENYGKLTITDTVGGGSIAVAGDAAIINAGTLTLKNVAVSSIYSDESVYDPIGIINESGATLNMTGGSINSEHIGLQNSGTATISDTTITVADGANDVIGIVNSGDLTIGDGVVINANGIGIINSRNYGGYSLRASRASVAGGVVNMNKGSSIIVNGEDEIGIRNDADECQILISGGTIDVQNGYGIDAYYGSVNMTGGIINVGEYSCGITAGSETGQASLEEGEPTIILDGTAAINVNGKKAEGIYLTNAKAAEIRGGTITVSATGAVG
ncbi:MAG: FecR domain-containing protein, partial [Anaerotignum sp.]|nr:FecR domain-containing protein [Anaerotignum sp.]